MTQQGTFQHAEQTDLVLDKMLLCCPGCVQQEAGALPERECTHIQAKIKKGGEMLTALHETIFKEQAYRAFSLLHLSQNHIMPRTLPLVDIIFAASMGLAQHWGTFRFTMAFFVAALAVLLISAMKHSPPI